MFLSPRIALPTLSVFCRRMALSTETGLDIRRTLSREADTGRAVHRREVAQMRDAVARGETLAEAINATGEYFPTLVRRLIAAGEKTGGLAEIWRMLADHFEHRLKLKRQFVAAITWPIIQLVIALLVIGLLIFVAGIIGDRPGSKPIDFVGLGLVGGTGVTIYFVSIAVIVAAGVALSIAAMRGAFGLDRLAELAYRAPVIGPALQKLALTRFASVMALAFNVEIDVKTSLALAFEATNTDYYRRHLKNAQDAIQSGDEIHEALHAAGVFPAEVIEAIAIGEASGRLSEAAGALARQYHEQSEASLQIINRVASFGVWAIVALFIIAMIFRLANFYLGVLNDALNMK